jgi:protocatechuate 3,4-dioxygenase beta subunit
MFTLSGRVTDSGTGTGLAGVLVKVVGGSGTNFGKSATTNATGHYSLTGLTAGTIIVEAFLAGYAPLDAMLTLTGNATHDFHLVSTIYTLKGQVTDALTGAPVGDALVKVVSGSGTNFGKSATTNASGHYAITGLTPGTIIVEAYLAYLPSDQMLTLSGNATQNFALSK